MPTARTENLYGLPPAVGTAAPPPLHPVLRLEVDTEDSMNNTIVLRSEELSGRSLSISHVKFGSTSEGCSLERSCDPAFVSLFFLRLVCLVFFV